MILPDSLVLYKKRPGRVVQVGDKLEIELDDGNWAKVRPKDILLLHPGPVRNLNELQPQTGEVELAWEILRDEAVNPHNLAELAELVYGKYTPSTAWAAWQLLDDGLYFRGTPEVLFACLPDEVARQQASRQARQSEANAWSAFLQRLHAVKISLPEDERYLREVAELAVGRRHESRILRELGRAVRVENAHALLLELGYWDYSIDPYPQRFGLPTSPPEIELPPLPVEPRLDLTHLPAFAIDDQENKDPDDALSLEACRYDENGHFHSGRLWVHVADVAALISPGSPADLEARGRGATLYLPEGPVPLLPPPAVEALGLGLHETSPALSFSIELSATGEITAVQIQPTWVHVERLSYEEANERLEEDPFRGLDTLAQAFQSRRQAQGALFIDLPESIIHVVNGRVNIRPLLRLRSRDLVREAMLMAGEASARFALEHRLPFPYAVQEASEPANSPVGNVPQADGAEDLASSFALRKSLKRSQVSSQPAPHAGVGLAVYTRATSPLRRYLDLVVHQQLRAYLQGQPLLNEQAMLERVGMSESITGSVAQTEALARRHWTLVYLMQNPLWRGEGVLVEKQDLRGKVIIPELALETSLHLRQDLPLNSRIPLAFQGANLPELEVYFTC
jgi:exoribonuclease-2